MRKILLFIGFALWLTSANSQITFERNYKGLWGARSYGIVQTPDQGYLFTGRDNGDSMIIGGLTPGGRWKWSKSFGGNDVSIGRYMIAASDGNYVVTGNTGDYDEVDYTKKLSLVKFDATGKVLFQRTFRGTDNLIGYTLAEAADGNYLVAAYCETVTAYDLRIYKFNKSTGDSMSCKTYSDLSYQIFFEMKKLKDNNYLLVGSRNSNLCLVKINTNGDTLWTKEILYNYSGYTFTEASDHGFIIGTDGAVIKTTSTGVIQWQKDQTDWGYSWTYLMNYNEIVPTLDGNYVLCGLWDTDAPWAFMAKFKPNGDTIFTRTFPTKQGNLYQEFFFMQATKDSGFIFCGDQYDTNTAKKSFQNMNFIKTDKNGYIYKMDTPRVCLVTVDPVLEKNKIIWERQNSKTVNYYAVCKREGLIWKSMIDKKRDSLSVYNDLTSMPENTPNKYCIMAISYNEDTLRSPFVETVLLQSSKGTSGAANLSWNPYLDESGKFIPAYYYIYKGKSKATVTLLDSISGDTKNPSYNDTHFDGTVTYYQVRFKKDKICAPANLKSESGPYSQSLSNIVEYKVSGLDQTNELAVSVYPNPIASAFSLSYQLEEACDVNLIISDQTGRIVFSSVYSNQNAGINTLELNPDILKLTTGTNYFRLIANDKISNIKACFMK